MTSHHHDCYQGFLDDQPTTIVTHHLDCPHHYWLYLVPMIWLGSSSVPGDVSMCQRNRVSSSGVHDHPVRNWLAISPGDRSMCCHWCDWNWMKDQPVRRAAIIGREKQIHRLMGFWQWFLWTIVWRAEMWMDRLTRWSQCRRNVENAMENVDSFEKRKVMSCFHGKNLDQNQILKTFARNYHVFLGVTSSLKLKPNYRRRYREVWAVGFITTEPLELH